MARLRKICDGCHSAMAQPRPAGRGCALQLHSGACGAGDGLALAQNGLLGAGGYRDQPGTMMMSHKPNCYGRCRQNRDFQQFTQEARFVDVLGIGQERLDRDDCRAADA